MGICIHDSGGNEMDLVPFHNETASGFTLSYPMFAQLGTSAQYRKLYWPGTAGAVYTNAYDASDSAGVRNRLTKSRYKSFEPWFSIETVYNDIYMYDQAISNNIYRCGFTDSDYLKYVQSCPSMKLAKQGTYPYTTPGSEIGTTSGTGVWEGRVKVYNSALSKYEYYSGLIFNVTDSNLDKVELHIYVHGTEGYAYGAYSSSLNTYLPIFDITTPSWVSDTTATWKVNKVMTKHVAPSGSNPGALYSHEISRAGLNSYNTSGSGLMMIGFPILNNSMHSSGSSDVWAVQMYLCLKHS